MATNNFSIPTPILGASFNTWGVMINSALSLIDSLALNSRGMFLPVRVVTASNIDLSGLQIISGIQLEDGDRVLVRSQSSLSENGIYVAKAGQWEVAGDFQYPSDKRLGKQVVCFSDGFVRVYALSSIVESPADVFSYSWESRLAVDAASVGTLVVNVGTLFRMVSSISDAEDARASTVARKVIELGTFSGNTTLNTEEADAYRLELSGTATLSLSGFLPTYEGVPAPTQSSREITINLKNGGLFPLSWGASIKWANGAPPSLTSLGRDVLRFYTDDQGATWYGRLVIKNVQ